jgi:predicted DNA-binding mobile mystery protein A
VRAVAAKPARGWLRAVREAIGLTQVEVAEKISIKRQSYAQLESAEEEGAISLSSLRRAAEALDCELIYFIVPRGSPDRTFAELAASHDPTAAHASASAHSMSLKSEPPPQ